MIIVRLWGGLGNQLFQYSFAKFIEKNRNEKVLFDISSFGTSDQLRKLEIYSLVPEISLMNVNFAKYTGLKNRLFRILFQCTNTYLTENKFAISSLDNSKGKIYLQGYWQDKKYAEYFPAYKVLNEWKVPEVLQRIKNIICSVDTAISIHVRRGDYFSNQNIGIYGVCTEKYYEKALSQVELKYKGNKQYFIFSDDISWVKSHLALPESAIFIPNYEISQFTYIYLMSLCKVNIISNSTFSWWGAYLNQHTDCFVIAPSRWTLTSDKTLALDNWLKI